MISLLKKIIDPIYKELLPDICYICREKQNQQFSICSDCYKKISFPNNPLCPACGAENDTIFKICSKCLKEDTRPWQNAITIANYSGIFKSIIVNFKYNKQTYLAKPLAQLAVAKFAQTGIKADCITPVPLHWSRELLRGYNQSELIASIFSQITNIPYYKLLKRIKPTPKQSLLPREQRKKNLLGAFSLSKKIYEFHKFKTILLLDDVLTTGSTMESATQTLLESGICENVNIISIARG